MKKFLLFCCAFSFVLVAWAQERTVTGTVTSTEDGSTLPGVNVLLKGTTTGGVTDADGHYSISVPQSGGTLVFSFIGLLTQEVDIGGRSVVDVAMASDVTQLGEVVVTALGVSRDVKTLPYVSQQVTSKDLNITQNTDFRAALAGKVAGIQVNGQAGSKLGEFGKIRIRGAISLTSDADPLYIIDNIPTTDPNDVDLNNVESINVLAGPSATALYGQRASNGVILMTTKMNTGKGVSVEYDNSTTWDKVSYLPKYQNLYGGGYSGNDSFSNFDYNNPPFGIPYPTMWSGLTGVRYLGHQLPTGDWFGDDNYADESWGPKFDGQPYMPWYAWWPDSPYFGQQQPYVAQPDNIRDFYQTGITEKNTVAIGGSGDNYSGRIAYTEYRQSGIIPSTDYKKHYVLANFSVTPISKLKVTAHIRYTNSKTSGYFDDGYGNQTSGSFNSWFDRQLETNRLKELENLKTPEGYQASWNWWGPDYYTLGGSFHKPAFWFNPYPFLQDFSRIGKHDNLAGILDASYQLTDNLRFDVTATDDYKQYNFDWNLPFSISNSAAPDLYNAWSNSFGTFRRNTVETNYTATAQYDKRFGDIDVSALIGGNLRKNTYGTFQAQMDPGAKSGGLIIPDVFTFANAGTLPTPSVFNSLKKVNSIYGSVSVGYKDMVYLDGSYRKDWSSALPANANGYGYPSLGASFVFSELLNSDVLSYGKLRGSWAQVGTDLDAYLLSPIYATGSRAFQGDKVLMYNPSQVIDPNIKPALNSSFETGFDLRFLQNRVGVKFTYYNEHHKDDIIPINIPQGSGYNTYLTNAGKSSRRGIEVVVDGDAIKSPSGFTWNIALTYSKNTTTIDELPSGIKAINAPGGFGESSTGVTDQSLSNTSDFPFISVINELDHKWGQLRGTKIMRDANGTPVLSSDGLYETVSDQYFGSVLPDFTGGLVNRVTYKGFSLAVSIDFQKGGKFFSLSEMWGEYSGLLDETASQNDKGMNVRDWLIAADGTDKDENGYRYQLLDAANTATNSGGVHSVGVDENGAPVDVYVDAQTYYDQWYSNYLAEPFVHDASYIKLRDVNLSYDFSKFIHSNVIKGATLGIVGRDLALLAVSKDNTNHWDPSIMSTNFGENGQLPGTRSFGVNVGLQF